MGERDHHQCRLKQPLNDESGDDVWPMAGQADMPNQALLFGFEQRLVGTAGTHMFSDLAVVVDEVHLVDVQVLSLEESEALLDTLAHPLGSGPARFRRQVVFATPMGHGIADEGLCLAVPAGKVVDALIEQAVDDGGGVGLGAATETIRPKPEGGNAHLGFTKFAVDHTCLLLAF